MPKSVPTSVGDKYGKLTVLSLGKKSSGGRTFTMAECACECGAKRTVNVWDLRSGKTRGCGKHPRYEDRSVPALNNLYKHSYMGRAKKAGLSFKISFQQFKELTQQDCHYCGAPPSSVSYRGRRGHVKTGKGVSVYPYNGLDRVDSKQGYSLVNVVPCCGVCNHAKHTMGYDDFVAWLKRAARFISMKQEE